jgi:hypothetical protein
MCRLNIKFELFSQADIEDPEITSAELVAKMNYEIDKILEVVIELEDILNKLSVPFMMHSDFNDPSDDEYDVAELVEVTEDDEGEEDESNFNFIPETTVDISLSITELTEGFVDILIQLLSQLIFTEAQLQGALSYDFQVL